MTKENKSLGYSNPWNRIFLQLSYTVIYCAIKKVQKLHDFPLFLALSTSCNKKKCIRNKTEMFSTTPLIMYGKSY